jgi:hypothetical protein
MQREAIDERHSDIGDQAIDLGQNTVFEERLSRRKRANRMSRRLQEILDRLENSNVIVNNGDFGFIRTHHFETIPTCREWVTGISSFSAILTRSASDAASIFCMTLPRWI